MYHQVCKKPAYPKRGGKGRFYYCFLKDTATEPEKGASSELTGQACSCGVRVGVGHLQVCAHCLHRSLECRPVVCAGPTPASASGVKMVMGEGCASLLSHRAERLGWGSGAPFPPPPHSGQE